MYRAVAFLRKQEHGPLSIAAKAAGMDIYRQKKKRR
jgi:hypothetical protein